MPDYAKMYRILFNAMTDALRELEAGRPEQARQIIIEAQRLTEELYMEA